ncbi:MAG: Hypothetical protein AJITA_00982 [Acetilactobacillus jinshanensis]
MIMSTVFGFSNVGIAYDQMGYASIIWYLVGAVTFFIPTSLMFAEYGSAWAFIGTFIWYVVHRLRHLRIWRDRIRQRHDR